MRASRGFDVLREVADAPPQVRRSPVGERQRLKALDLLRREQLVETAYCYCIVPLDAPPAALLHAGGESLEAPWLLPESGELTALACAVCTIGTTYEHRVSQLFADRQASLAMALNDLGNELLFAVSRRAQDRIQADVNRRGLTMAGELRPGDPGLSIEAQGPVLRLACADAIGITLGQGGLMNPVKSCSMVLGVGIGLPAAKWSRCDHCPTRNKCRVVERAAGAAV
jgi:hypothetical protein